MNYLLFTAADLWFIYTLLGVLVAGIVLIFVCGLKKCPSDKIMIVVNGRGKNGQHTKCLHGGVTFVMPFIESCLFMSIEPINSELVIERELTTVRVCYSAAISTEPNAMLNAAERLLGLDEKEVKELMDGLAKEVICEVKAASGSRDSIIKGEVKKSLAVLGMELINIEIKENDV